MTPRARGILVTLSGYPQVPSNFMPDNGLANLAAVGRELGHELVIHDLNTPQTMARLFPEAFRKRLAPFEETLLDPSGLGDETFERLKPLLAELEAHQQAQYQAFGEELAARVEREKIDFIGFKLWNGDGYLASKRMAEVIKARCPRTVTLVGGAHVDYFMEHLLLVTEAFDFAAYAEGEPILEPFFDFLAGKAPIEEVPNLLFRKGDRAHRTPLRRVDDLNDLPLPRYDLDHYPAMAGDAKAHVGVYEETRGCPIKCNFCAHPVKAGERLRKKDLGRVVDELTVLRERYGLSAYKFSGSFTPTRYLERLSQKLVEHELGLDFVAFGHVGDSKNADYEVIRRAGCHALFFGVESGSELIMQRSINERKKHGEGLANRVLKRAKAAGIFTITSIIYPNVGETPETRAETLRLLEDVRPDSVPCHWPILIPNTPWSRDPIRFGFDVPSQKAYLDNFLSYKVRLMYPPKYWDPFVFTVDGKDFKRYAGENAEFIGELERRGMLTLVSDDTALLAKLAGKSAREFRDQCRRNFLLGDAEAMSDLVATINENAKRKLRVQPTPRDPVRARSEVNLSRP